MDETQVVLYILHSTLYQHVLCMVSYRTSYLSTITAGHFVVVRSNRFVRWGFSDVRIELNYPYCAHTQQLTSVILTVQFTNSMYCKVVCSSVSELFCTRM